MLDVLDVDVVDVVDFGVNDNNYVDIILVLGTIYAL